MSMIDFQNGSTIVNPKSFMSVVLIARSFTCCPWSLFLASFLLCQSDVRAQFHFTCGTMNGTLLVPPSIAPRGREMVAGGGL
jgi:hypothetical protein